MTTNALPNVEVFYLHNLPNADLIREGYKTGWYWWPCFPGCLPDGEPSGPFKSEADAKADSYYA